MRESLPAQAGGQKKAAGLNSDGHTHHSRAAMTSAIESRIPAWD